MIVRQRTNERTSTSSGAVQETSRRRRAWISSAVERETRKKLKCRFVSPTARTYHTTIQHCTVFHITVCFHLPMGQTAAVTAATQDRQQQHKRTEAIAHTHHTPHSGEQSLAKQTTTTRSIIIMAKSDETKAKKVRGSIDRSIVGISLRVTHSLIIQQFAEIPDQGQETVVGFHAV